MTRELRSSRPASEEFAEAVRWYEERRRGLGAEFFDAVAATMAMIADDPEIGTEVDADELTRRVLVSRFPYQIGLGKLYRCTGNGQQAQEHITAAITMYREMEMGFWLGKAEAELRR